MEVEEEAGEEAGEEDEEKGRVKEVEVEEMVKLLNHLPEKEVRV